MLLSNVTRPFHPRKSRWNALACQSEHKRSNDCHQVCHHTTSLNFIITAMFAFVNDQDITGLLLTQAESVVRRWNMQ